MLGDVDVLCAAVSFMFFMFFMFYFITIRLECNDRSILILVHERCLYLRHVVCNCMCLNFIT